MRTDDPSYSPDNGNQMFWETASVIGGGNYFDPGDEDMWFIAKFQNIFDEDPRFYTGI